MPLIIYEKITFIRPKFVYNIRIYEHLPEVSMPDLTNTEPNEPMEELELPPAQNEAPAEEPLPRQTLAEAVGAKLRRPAGADAPGPLAAVKAKLSHKKAPKEPELPPELLAIKEGPRTGQDSKDGLTTDEVTERTLNGDTNRTTSHLTRTTGQIVRTHTLTYFNFLNIALAVLILISGQFKNILFLGTVITNTLVGIIQELKVKSLIDGLAVITTTHVKALRDGQEKDIPVDEIVIDDVILAAPGDQIVTDGTVLEADGLEVNESMLTGEAKPVKKKKGDSLLSGSFIVSGTVKMKVTAVGNDSYAATIVNRAARKKRASSEMQVTIGRIIKVVSIAIIPIGLLLFQSQQAAAEGDFSTAIVRTVSGIIGMIPEGLVLLTSVSFIIGVGRLARKNALVQEMEAIEALARTNILCTDKTGTITTGELKVKEIVTLGTVGPEGVKEIFRQMNGAFSDVNPTQAAVDSYFGRELTWTVRGTIPFSSSRKFKAASFAEGGDYAVGAPEVLARGNEKLRRYITRYTKKGFRVLLLCASSGIDPDTENAGLLSPIALVVLSDIIKADAKATFDYFAKAGVAVKVLSGDNPLTVSTIAQQAGVAGAEKYVDASTLPKDPIALAQAIAQYNVFGRVQPEQKQAFVKAWQANGKTVTMVGDGVNDVLAIKDADCGIAMAKGSEAAKQAAHIVLLDSDFSSMTNIVSEGKTIISNIERVSSLYLTKTIYSAVLSIIFILLRSTYPFTTLQMGLINLCCIGLPSFLLTLEQREKVTSDGFLKHVLAVCLPAAMTMVTSMLLVQVLNLIFKWPADIFSTFNLMLGGLVGLLVVADVCWPLNTWRRFIVVLCIAIFISAVILLPRFYDMHPVFMGWALLLIPLFILTMMMIYWYSRVTNRFMRWFYREDRRRF